MDNNYFRIFMGIIADYGMRETAADEVAVDVDPVFGNEVQTYIFKNEEMALDFIRKEDEVFELVGA